MQILLTGIRRADGEEEQIRIRADGTVTVSEGKTVLSYVEEGGAAVTVTVENGRLTMVRREGGIFATLPMALFQSLPCEYQTAYGAFPVTVTLYRLQNDLTAAGGALHLDYDLSLGGGITRTSLHITVK